MNFIETDINGVWLVMPKRFGDARGYFCESFKRDQFTANIGIVDFIQDNESFSTRGVLRGLHYQAGEYSQAKLVRVSRGKVLDVAVDLRRSSPTFGKHVAQVLDDESGVQLFIPRGFAHGFVVLSDVAQFQYKVDNIYAPHAEVTLLYNDPSLGIDWMLPDNELKLSPKDIKGKPLTEIPTFE